MYNKDIQSLIEAGDRLKGYLKEIHSELSHNPKSIIILDDDPTGTQTVSGIPVITTWAEKELETELLTSPVFFILTNSRSLQADEANQLGKMLGKRLRKLAKKHQKRLLLVSRSDSTLRGHYPKEVDALTDGLGWINARHIVVPAFFEGGRYTCNDIHFVKEKDEFIPAAKTPFAKDNTFGYSASNLRDWIFEKSEGKILREKISSISIHDIRHKPIRAIQSDLESSDVSHIVANATSYPDLQKLAIASLLSSQKFIYRSGASFVNAITGITTKPCLAKKDIIRRTKAGGALIIIGSYVPKTTSQLNFLKMHSSANFLEIDVTKVLDLTAFNKEIVALAEQVDDFLHAHQDVVLFTSRTVIKGSTKVESLEIVNLVSNGIIALVRKLKNRPKYILAKGGITSSDIATKALSVRRAMVLGQIIEGVSVWQLGKEAKFPDLPYIVFPGNVGNEDALHKATKLLA